MLKDKKITLLFKFMAIVLFAMVFTSCSGKSAEQAPSVEQNNQQEASAALPTIPPVDSSAPAAQAESSSAQTEASIANPQEINRWGKGRINGVGYLANSKLLAVGTTLGIDIYDTGSWEKLRSMDACPEGLFSLAVIPTSEIVAAGCNNGLIQLWNANDGSLIKELEGHTQKITALSFSADGQSLISGSQDYSVRIWKVADGSLVKAFEEKISSIIYAVALSSDSSIMAVGLDEAENQLMLWKVNEEEPYMVNSDHYGPISDVIFTADNTKLISSSRDGKIKIWDVAQGKEISTISTEKLPEFNIPTPTIDPNITLDAEAEEKLAAIETMRNPFVFYLSISPDGQNLAASYFDDVIRIWRLSDGNLVQTLKGHKAIVFNIAYSADGNNLVSRSVDGTVRVWQLSDGSESKVLDYGYSLTTISYSPDGSKILAAGELTVAQLRQVSDGSVIYYLTNFTSNITSSAYSNDGSKIALGSIDGTAKVYQESDGATQFILSPKGPVLSIAIAPDNKTVAAGTGISNQIDMWNGEESVETKSLIGHGDNIYSLAFSPDGTLLASGSKDNNVILWFVQDGRQLGIFGGHSGPITSVAFNPSGDVLASGSIDLSIRLWKIPSGEELRTIQLSAPVTSIGYSKDGSMLAAGLINGTAVILPITSQTPDTPLANFKAHKGEITSIKFSPDQTTLTTASRDGTVRFWKIK